MTYDSDTHPPKTNVIISFVKEIMFPNCYLPTSPCIGGVYSENRSYTAISVETVIFKVTLSKESSLKPPFLGKKMMVFLDPISKLIKRKICVTAR